MPPTPHVSNPPDAVHETARYKLVPRAGQGCCLRLLHHQAARRARGARPAGGYGPVADVLPRVHLGPLLRVAKRLAALFPRPTARLARHHDDAVDPSGAAVAALPRADLAPCAGNDNNNVLAMHVRAPTDRHRQHVCSGGSGLAAEARAYKQRRAPARPEACECEHKPSAGAHFQPHRDNLDRFLEGDDNLIVRTPWAAAHTARGGSRARAHPRVSCQLPTRSRRAWCAAARQRGRFYIHAHATTASS